MASLREIQRKKYRSDRSEIHRNACAALTLLLEVLDAFKIQKQEGGRVKMTAHIGIFSTELAADNCFELAQPLGDWLTGLPKGVWEGRERSI